MQYLYIFVFKIILKPTIKAPFMSGLCVVWKPTPWCFRYRWIVALTNSVPLSHYRLNGFLFWNKDILKLQSCPSVVRSKHFVKMTLKRYLYLSLYFEGAQIRKIHFPEIINICYNIRISQKTLTYSFMQNIRFLTWKTLVKIIYFIFTGRY